MLSSLWVRETVQNNGLPCESVGVESSFSIDGGIDELGGSLASKYLSGCMRTDVVKDGRTCIHRCNRVSQHHECL